MAVNLSAAPPGSVTYWIPGKIGKMLKAALGSLFLASIGFAQTPEAVPVAPPMVSIAPVENVSGRHPLSVRLGAWLPAYEGNGISRDAGFAYGLAYRVIQNERYSIEAEYFASTHEARQTVATRGINTWSLGGNILFHRGASELYYGVGVGFAKTESNLPAAKVSNNVKLGVSGIVGYNLSEKLFGELRYAANGEEKSRGVAVLLGYRF